MSQRGFQFQVGLSLVEFVKLFGTEKKCQCHFESQKWPDGFKCRQCGCKEYCTSKRGTQLLYHCRSCRSQESLRSGTLMHGSQQPFMKWYMSIQLMTQSKNCISSLELHRQLDVSYNTAWLIKHKIMEMMFMAENQRFSGYIEIDETHLEKYPVEHDDRQQKRVHNFRPFIAALETGADGRPIFAKFNVVKNFEKESLKSWLEDNVSGRCETICDTQHCYETLCDICQNKAQMLLFQKNEKRGKFDWMNIILSNIKASLYGTFHNIDFERYGYRYLADLQYRFNRRFDLKAMFYGLISTAAKALHAVFLRPDPVRVLMVEVE